MFGFHPLSQIVYAIYVVRFSLNSLSGSNLLLVMHQLYNFFSYFINKSPIYRLCITTAFDLVFSSCFFSYCDVSVTHVVTFEMDFLNASIYTSNCSDHFYIQMPR
uniref:Uncharacterized protein n=1 Tax=Octopus bimaculoides TaxID=37653 RepID=A0A0L8FL43_OCTBM